MDIVNYLVCKQWPDDYNAQQSKRLVHESKFYCWDEPYLYRLGPDHILRQCTPEYEMQSILASCHKAPYRGHFGGQRTTAKLLQSGYFWPTLFKDARAYVVTCDRCQRTGNISNKNEMPLNSILKVELFNVWDIDFIGPFPPSCSHQYILVVVDYVSKWVEAISCAKNDAITFSKFLKNTSSRVFERQGLLSVMKVNISLSHNFWLANLI